MSSLKVLLPEREAHQLQSKNTALYSRLVTSSLQLAAVHAHAAGRLPLAEQVLQQHVIPVLQTEQAHAGSLSEKQFATPVLEKLAAFTTRQLLLVCFAGLLFRLAGLSVAPGTSGTAGMQHDTTDTTDFVARI